MSCTNNLSSGDGTLCSPFVGANEPTGLGTLNVPRLAQLSCQLSSIRPASSAV